METEEFRLGDWQRVLMGEVPAAFFIEVIIRTIIIYLILIISIRLMGKRMALQLNINQMTAMVALAAAIGVPLQAPDRGILPAAIIAFVVVVSERAISRIVSRNQKLEKISQGDIIILIEDSVLQYGRMKKVRISRDRLFEQIRAQGMDHLGKVKRLYMESSGTFSLVRETGQKPGLSVIPANDADYWEDKERCSDIYVCSKCGYSTDKVPTGKTKCDNCGNPQWETAIL